MLSRLIKNIGRKKTASSVERENLPFPNNVMLENYRLAQKDYAPKHKSQHWDNFLEDYEQVICTTALWEGFRRNGITAGYDDNDVKTFMSVQGQQQIGRTCSIPENITEPESIDDVIKLYNGLRRLAGDEHIRQVYQAEIGSPRRYQHNGLHLNYTDLPLTYFSWQIRRALSNQDGSALIFAEIGAGYGGLVAQLRRIFPKDRFILFDLPEVNCAQTYYLCKSFPDSKFFLYSDFKAQGIKAFISGDHDFAILPGWCIENLPASSIDVAINIRSMMEMNWDTVRFYFDHIHRCVKTGGLFYCVNRYHKSTSGQDIRIRDYPFDGYWQLLLSQACWAQTHIHELLVQRIAGTNAYPLQRALASLPPW